MESLSDLGRGLCVFCPWQLCGCLAMGPPGYQWVWICFPFPLRPHKSPVHRGWTHPSCGPGRSPGEWASQGLGTRQVIKGTTYRQCYNISGDGASPLADGFVTLQMPWLCPCRPPVSAAPGALFFHSTVNRLMAAE